MLENQSQLQLLSLHRRQRPKRVKRGRLRCLIMRISFTDGKSQAHQSLGLTSVLETRQVHANEVNVGSIRWNKSMNNIIKYDFNT